MQFLIENWFVFFAAIVSFAIAVYTVVIFMMRPRSEQIEAVREWLLYAVTEAERELGSGTGQLKLRLVYNAFIENFGYIAYCISFERFSELVDESLVKMKELIATNKAVREYVNGSEDDTKEVQQNE